MTLEIISSLLGETRKEGLKWVVTSFLFIYFSSFCACAYCLSEQTKFSHRQIGVNETKGKWKMIQNSEVKPKQTLAKILTTEFVVMTEVGQEKPCYSTELCLPRNSNNLGLKS